MWPGPISGISVRSCGCSFCRKHAGAWTSNRGSKLKVTLSDPTLVSRYRFGTKSADFYVCSVCGAVPLVISEIEGNQYAVVNVNTFEDIDTLSLSNESTNFDGETGENRLARRKRNWIPDVQVVP
ncbi:MAG: hypothetical protein GY949_04770 [Gammaproteobacteria bacterium]|nr:hypothetical protein [Gammaproteobacteria bacterium]